MIREVEWKKRDVEYGRAMSSTDSSGMLGEVRRRRREVHGN